MRILKWTILSTVLCATAATAEVPKVVTDFGPVDSLVRQVMGDLGTPFMLLPQGGDPHDLQLRPSQATELAGADLVFWVGPELMPALQKAVDNLGPGKSVALLHSGGGTVRRFAGEEGTDPHAWLDPTNAAAWVHTIGKALSAADPEHAETYAANAGKAQSELAALDAELTTALAPVRTRPFVVFHDALGYFADHFGVNVAGAIELGDASTPGAARLTELRQTIAGAGAVCIFPEAGRDPGFILTVTEGSQAKVGAPQDIEGTTLTPGPDVYAALLRNLTKTLTDCLSD